MSPVKSATARPVRPRRACVTARHWSDPDKNGATHPLLPVSRRSLRLLRERYGVKRIHKVRDRYQEELRQRQRLKLKAAEAQDAEKRLAAAGVPIAKFPL